jgi:hypothetical protein
MLATMSHPFFKLHWLPPNLVDQQNRLRSLLISAAKKTFLHPYPILLSSKSLMTQMMIILDFHVKAALMMTLKQRHPAHINKNWR